MSRLKSKTATSAPKRASSMKLRPDLDELCKDASPAVQAFRLVRDSASPDDLATIISEAAQALAANKNAAEPVSNVPAKEPAHPAKHLATDDSEYLSLREAARLVNTSDRNLRRWRVRYELDNKVPSGRVRILREKLITTAALVKAGKLEL